MARENSGWGYDPSRRLTYRRVDGYLTPMAIPLNAVAGVQPMVSHHRPLSAYVNGLAAAGFAVTTARSMRCCAGSMTCHGGP